MCAMNTRELTPLTPAQDFVYNAYRFGALELLPNGRMTKSKRLSPYFFNSGLFCTGETMDFLATAYAAAIKPFSCEVVYGPPYKGIPLSTMIAMKVGGQMGSAWSRKEAKDHGEGGIMGGMSVKGKRTGLADDVMTTGDSLRKGIELIRAFEGIPTCVAISFDREELPDGGTMTAVQQFEQDNGIPVAAAAKLSDLIDLIKQSNAQSFYPILDKILEYKAQYGAK